MADIHNRNDKLDATLQKIENSQLSSHNIELIKEFHNHIASEGLSTDRSCRYLSSFNTLANHIDFPLDQADKKRLKSLVATINQGKIERQDGSTKEYSPWTLAEFKKAIKKFYQFQTGEDEPELVDFITVNVKENQKQRVDPDNLLRPGHIKELIKAAQYKRDKALIFMLWETGCRISELLNVKWKDLKFGEDKTKLRIRESKSMPRSIYIKESVEVLKEWRNQHEESSDPENYVFVKFNQSNCEQYTQLSYAAAYGRIKKAFNHTDLPDNLKINPHAFRKARATWLASEGWNAAQLCQWFGWKDFSTAREYIRLAKQDLEQAFEQMHGMTQEEQEQGEDLSPTRCGQCEEVNGAERDYCKNCETSLATNEELFKEVQKDEIAKESMEDIITSLLEEYVEDEEQAREKTESLVEESVEKKLRNKGIL